MSCYIVQLLLILATKERRYRQHNIHKKQITTYKKLCHSIPHFSHNSLYLF